MVMASAFQFWAMSCVIVYATATMMATAATFTPSSSAPSKGFLRILWTRGLSSKTKINDGKNIPIVAAKAPCQQFSCQPMKVAVESTGPGVNCPAPTASIKPCCVSQPLSTKADSRKAKRTYPLP